MHPAAADLQMIAATNTLRIVGGAGEVARYDVGDIIDCSGFVNAANNLPGYPVLSVTVNGADLDIVLDPINNVLVNEAAAGVRDIRLVCRSIFGYCAAANAVSLGGYTDWRVPYDVELASLREMEAPSAVPDAVAFPGWPNDYLWASTSTPSALASAMRLDFTTGIVHFTGKTASFLTALVRG